MYGTGRYYIKSIRALKYDLWHELIKKIHLSSLLRPLKNHNIFLLGYRGGSDFYKWWFKHAEGREVATVNQSLGFSTKTANSHPGKIFHKQWYLIQHPTTKSHPRAILYGQEWIFARNCCIKNVHACSLYKSQITMTPLQRVLPNAIPHIYSYTGILLHI